MMFKPLAMLVSMAVWAFGVSDSNACLRLSDTPETLLGEIPAKYADSPVKAKVRVLKRVERPYDHPHHFHPRHGLIIKVRLLQFQVVLVEVVDAIAGAIEGETYYLKIQSVGGCGPSLHVSDGYFVAGEVHGRTLIPAWRVGYRRGTDE